MKLDNRLLNEELATKIIKAWDNIQDYKGWTLECELARWKIELLSYIKSESKENLDFILKYLYDMGPAPVYLEFNSLVTDYNIEKNDNRSNNFSSIIHIYTKIKEKIIGKKICFDSSIHIGRGINDNSKTRSGRGS